MMLQWLALNQSYRLKDSDNEMVHILGSNVRATIGPHSWYSFL